MKKILLISKQNNVVNKSIREKANERPIRYDFDFKDGIPVEVPEVFAKALLKTYPEIYSVSKLTKAEIEALVKKAEKKAKKAKVVEKVEEELVDPFKDGVPKEDIPKELGQHFPIEKTNFTEDELGKLFNRELTPILRKNNGQEELPVNTKKTDLIELILEAQKG